MSGTDLPGVWHGAFNYPRALPPENFTATLVDRGGALAGETEEAGSDSRICTGLIHGYRAGTAVSFIKTYDDRHGWPVRYDGTLDADGCEIAGTWRIDGQWSGSFVMGRSPPIAATIEQRETTTV